MAMERAEWLKRMQAMAEQLYDRLAPLYWVRWGLEENETHLRFLKRFLECLPPGGMLLSAACGAGRYEGYLLEAGHRVVGIDQAERMLDRAREHFPQVQYERMALQEIAYRETFDGIICMDAMEHVCPEDYPRILENFAAALKPGGVLYYTADRAEEPDFDLDTSYERARAMGLPVVYGEVADTVEADFQKVMELGLDSPDELTDRAVYHYYPPLAQIREWIAGAGLEIVEEGVGSGFHHFLLRKRD